MARDYPRESRLFAGEILQGAPHIADVLSGPLKDLVDAKAAGHPPPGPPPAASRRSTRTT